MCDLCDEYKRLVEIGRDLANERDRLMVESLASGGEPPFLEVPDAPVRPRCKDKVSVVCPHDPVCARRDDGWPACGGK